MFLWAKLILLRYPIYSANKSEGQGLGFREGDLGMVFQGLGILGVFRVPREIERHSDNASMGKVDSLGMFHLFHK